ncbi:CP51A demethylase, partial [Polypterus senegalus]|nr:CP51A demethylase [Polypterus senegalus]
MCLSNQSVFLILYRQWAKDILFYDCSKCKRAKSISNDLFEALSELIILTANKGLHGKEIQSCMYQLYADLNGCFTYAAWHRDGCPLSNDKITGMLIGLLLPEQHTLFTASAWMGFSLARVKSFQDQCFVEHKAMCSEDLLPVKFEYVKDQIFTIIRSLKAHYCHLICHHDYKIQKPHFDMSVILTWNISEHTKSQLYFVVPFSSLLCDAAFPSANAVTHC